jgi:hypothetical protein
MFDSLKMVGITPAFVQLFILAGIGGFLLFTFWRFFVLGSIVLFLCFTFAGTSSGKNDETIETYIKNGYITKEGVKIPPAPKEYIEDCMVHLKMSEEMCKQTWTQ